MGCLLMICELELDCLRLRSGTRNRDCYFETESSTARMALSKTGAGCCHWLLAGLRLH